jgi:hypothetical protein
MVVGVAVAVVALEVVGRDNVEAEVVAAFRASFCWRRRFLLDKRLNFIVDTRVPSMAIMAAFAFGDGGDVVVVGGGGGPSTVPVLQQVLLQRVTSLSLSASVDASPEEDPPSSSLETKGSS